MESFNLDIIPRGTMPACHSSQFDVGRTIRVYLLDNGQEYTLDGTETLTLSVRKPDNTVITETLTGGANHNYVDFSTTEQMTAIVGQSICEIRIEKDGANIGTLNFVLEVEKDPLSSGIHSESVITDLQAQVDEAVAVSMSNYYTKAEVDAGFYSKEYVEANYYTKDETDEKIAEAVYDVYPTQKASGEVANFITSLALPLQSLKASIVATESGSGTKSPSNPYTLGGFSNVVITKAGKNIFNLKDGVYTPSNRNITINNQIVNYKCTGVVGLTYILRGDLNAWNKLRLDANKTYIFSFFESGNIGFQNVFAEVLHDDGTTTTLNNGVAKTLTKSGYISEIRCSYIATVANTESNITMQLELGSTATAYEPYTATQTTLALGQTVYGGEIVLTKKQSGYGVKLRVTKAIVDGGDMNWIYQSTYDVFYDNTISTKNHPTYMLCDIYEFKGAYTTMVDKSCGYIYTYRICVRDSSYNGNATAFKTAMAGHKFIYSLATPIEIDLTDLSSDILAYVGVNNVWSDTGDIEVEFKCAINDLLQALNVAYDNGVSGLTATNTQAAIDELAGANRSVNPLRTTAPVEEPETRDEPETDEPETRGDDNER